MQLWLIPLLPLLGFALNGIFGKKLSKSAVSVIWQPRRDARVTP